MYNTTFYNLEIVVKLSFRLILASIMTINSHALSYKNIRDDLQCLRKKKTNLEVFQAINL